MIAKSFSFLIFFFAYSFANAQFYPVNSPTQKLLWDVVFLDHDVGIVVGDSGTILKSIDGGMNWNLVHQEDTVYLQKVAFFNATDGIAIGSDLFKTTDAGSSWSPIQHTNQFFSDIAILDSSSCIISGYPTALLKSNDSGASFTDLIGPNTNEEFGLLSFVNDSLGYACPKRGGANTDVTQKTTDGGLSWVTIMDSGPSVNFTIMEAMVYISENIGFKAGWYNPHLQRTVDGGHDWEHAVFSDSIFTPQFLDLHIKPDQPNAYYACGWSGEIVKSTDGGNSWFSVNPVIPNTPLLHGIFFIDEWNGWAVGSNGTILKTSNGAVGLESTSDQEVTPYLYPNPSSGLFTIQLPNESQLFSTRIFDIKGKLVTVWEGDTTVVDLENQAAGFYWVALHTSHGVLWQKVIKY